MLQKIEKIKLLRLQKSRLVEQEALLSKPLLTDLNMIVPLYRWFREILMKQDFTPRIESVTQRKKFLFIILYLYSPATLAGGKMAVGLRDKLAEVLEIHSRTTISDNCADIVFLYNRYKNFRQEVLVIYDQLNSRLKTYGLFIDPAA